jgi:Spy/CpxP family protein refolding chaperone
MCQGKEMMGGGMMQGGMMGPEMMGPMMSSMMDGMMPGKTRGCMMMAEGMMKGQMDMAQMHKALAMSDEQTEKLRASLRPFQKEAILTLASMKVAELELTDLLAGEKVDFAKVEAKLKEIETMRTKARLAHLKASEAVKGVLNKEQLEKLQGAVESTPTPPAPATPQKDAPSQKDSEHEKHH